MTYNMSRHRPTRHQSSEKKTLNRTKLNADFGVLLAIRNEILREGLRSMIADCGFRVFDCESTSDGFEVDDRKIQMCRIFVFDGSNNAEYRRSRQLVDRIRACSEKVHFVILVPPDFGGSIDPAVVADASAIVTTDIKAYLLVNLLQLVSQNYVIRAADLTKELDCPKSKDDGERTIQPISTPKADANSFAGLSGREREILLHVTRGSSNKVIARALGISEATVKIHVKGIFRKIGVVNRTQAAFYVFRQGWLGDDDATAPAAAPRVPQKTNGLSIEADIVIPGVNFG